MALFLGLDAGGTSTQCILGDETRVLARAESPSIKVIRVSSEEAWETLRTLLSDVTQRAGASLDQICATCAGVAGFRIPAVGGWVRTSLGALVSGRVMVCGDDEIAIDAAFPGQAGILVIAGTGANVVARTSTGERCNVGGWGPNLGDEGSAYWIGQQALRSAMRAIDRGEPTMLPARVAEFWGLAELWDLVEEAHATPPPDFAALAPLVSSCAEAGDALCFEVLTEAARHLAEAAVLAFRKLSARDPGASPSVGLAFTGSILSSVGIVRETMIESIRRQLPAIHIVSQAVDPAVGALWRARSLMHPRAEAEELPGAVAP